MRIAHVTDLHVHVPLRLRECFNKRMLGLANFYLRGRRKHFSRAAQEAAVRDALATEPDAVLCSGDLTAFGTPAEFRAARELLEPLFTARPCALIPGNHDVYVHAAERERRIERFFSEWTGTGDWPRIHLLGDEVGVVAIDVCRARWIMASGAIDDPQIERIPACFEDPRLAGRAIVVMVHYPLRDRRGDPYGPWTRNVAGAAKLEAALEPYADRVAAIVHGHDHHGFRTSLHGIPILNPGASGYAHLPERDRTAHFGVYTFAGGRLADVERFAFDGERFVPEEGGAWATGR